MKMFHALLGYLAITTLPSSFHPFAYPLAAINDDGYVTTQNQGDSALMKRVPQTGEIIGLPELGVIFALVAASVITVAWILTDNPVGGNDVKFLVEHFDQMFSSRGVQLLLLIPSTRSHRSIRNGTGLFATPIIPSGSMEKRAGTGVTPITN